MKLKAEDLPAPPDGYRWEYDIQLGESTDKNTVPVVVTMKLVPDPFAVHA